jgi:LysM repeat protein/DNA-binding SARP family transcriptional activator
VSRRHADRSRTDRLTGAAARLGWVGVALLVGVAAPYAIWRVAGWPLPHHVPSRRQVWATLTTRYPDPRLYLDVLACLFWYVWFSAAASVPVEVAAILRGRPRLRIPLPGPGQALVATLISGLLLTGTRQRPAATPAVPTAQTFRLAAATAGVNRPPSPRDLTRPVTAPSGPAARPGSAAGPVVTVVVRDGDTLWGIAQAHLGDPMRYRELARLNHGRLQPDGMIFTDPNDIYPGWTLLVPAAGPPDAGHGPAAPTDSRGSLQPTTSSHTVMPGESLSSIVAGSYPGLDAQGLADAVQAVFGVNLGVTDGHGRILHDPDLIDPGMVLRLPVINGHTPTPVSGPVAPGPAQPPPADTERPPSPPPPAPAAPSPTVPAAPSPAVSPPPSPVGSAAAPVPATPGPAVSAGAAQPPASPPRPDTTPSQTAPATATPTPRTTPTSPPTPTRSSVPAATSLPRPSVVPARPAGHQHRGDDLPLWVGGAGLLSAAVALALASRRRHRDHQVGTAAVPPPADPSLTDLHAAVLRARGGAAEVTDRLDLALRTIATLHADGPPATGPAPRPQVLLVRPDGTIDVFLAEPVAPPAPWRSQVDGRIWVLPADAELSAPPDMPPPCPALVQIGTDTDGAAVYTDLEALGVLVIDPAGEQTAGLRGLARAILATVVLSPLAGLPTVRTWGFDPLGLADEERLTPARDLPTLVGDALSDAARTGDQLDADHQPTTLSARARHPQDNWDPTIAIIGPADDDAEGGDGARDPQVAALLDAAGDGGRGLAVILPAGPTVDAPWRLTLTATDPARWRLDPLNLTLTPTTLAAAELRDLLDLLHDADQPPVPVEEPPADPDTEAFTDPEWAVMVRLLGPLDVIGAAGQAPAASLARERTLEVLAWLALHPGRTRTDLEAAIWPGGAQLASINNQISRARAILAALAGEDARTWISLQHTTIRLNRAVITDLDLLRARIAHADRQRDHPTSAIRTLQGALDLVRGTPAAMTWMEAELGSIMTTTVVGAALRLAALQLARGDTDAALAATGRGLAILPAHPGLFALRLRAHAAAGDRTAIRAEYHAYLRAEQADPLYDGDTDRALERLAHDLMRQDPTREGRGAVPAPRR